MNFHANWADEFRPLLRQKRPRQPSAGMDGLVIRREEVRRSNTRAGGREYLHDAVFPKIVKAGLMIGGLGGEGVLFERGRPTGYYKMAAASFGFQAGGQQFSYALFFMNDKALKYLRDSDGWAIGSGPSVVVVDKGAAKSTTSTTIAKDVYAMPFGQKGLMAGLGLEGSKISRINR